MSERNWPNPVIRRNRRPTPQERVGILAQIEADTSYLNMLSDQLASRTASHERVISKVQSATKNYEEAKLRLKTTKESFRKLEASLKGLHGNYDADVVVVDGIPNPSNPSNSNSFLPSHSPDDRMAQSDHFIATQSSRKRRVEVASFLTKEVEAASTDVRDALESIAMSHEDIQCATSLQETAGTLVKTTLRYIKEVGTAINAHRDRLRAAWSIPADVWRDIFRLVVANEDGDMIKPRSIHLLVLSSVCYTWRSVLRSDSRLWSQIPAGGWASINSIAVPPRSSGTVNSLAFLEPLVSGIQSLELHGKVVDLWMPYLLGEKVIANQFASISMIPTIFKSLKKLTIVDYSGNGETILQLVEIRQAFLHGITWEHSSFMFRTRSAEATPFKREEPSNFVKYFYQHFGLGSPQIEIQHLDASLFPDSHRIGHLRYGGRTVVEGSGANMENVTTNIFRSAAQIFRQHDPDVWSRFRKNEAAVPQIRFRVDLRNCGKIDARVRQKMALYK